MHRNDVRKVVTTIEDYAILSTGTEESQNGRIGKENVRDMKTFKQNLAEAIALMKYG